MEVIEENLVKSIVILSFSVCVVLVLIFYLLNRKTKSILNTRLEIIKSCEQGKFEDSMKIIAKTKAYVFNDIFVLKAIKKIFVKQLRDFDTVLVARKAMNNISSESHYMIWDVFYEVFGIKSIKFWGLIYFETIKNRDDEYRKFLNDTLDNFNKPSVLNILKYASLELNNYININLKDIVVSEYKEELKLELKILDKKIASLEYI